MRKVSAAVAAAVAGLWSMGALGQVVTKVAEDFDGAPWVQGPYVTATPEALSSEEGQGGCMKLVVHWPGRFGGFDVDPRRPLVIPGKLKKVTLRTRIPDKRYAVAMSFRDGWGREKANGKDLKWEMKNPGGEAWVAQSFNVPADWVQPITISAIGGHNWETQGQKNDTTMFIDELSVETDLTDVDAATGALKTWVAESAPADPAKAVKECPRTPLTSVQMATTEEGNVFTATAPTALVSVRNWNPGNLSGKLTYEVLDVNQKVVDKGERAISVESAFNVKVPLKVERFGRYVVKAEVALSSGVKKQEEMAFAKLPAPRELSEAQKDISPYGLNYHGGAGLMLSPFRKAGLVWFREYAFSYDWLLRAKGADRSYAGWPFYPKIVKAYEDAGARVMPVFMVSIKPPKMEGGKVVGPIGPDEKWVREIMQVMLSFPQISDWELCNEYDLKQDAAAAESLINWENYKKYHAAFGEIVKTVGFGKWRAVENGRAGVWPERVEDCVRSGYFADINVVNSHHYCGVNPPETNYGNFNTGFGGQGDRQAALLFDDLRATTKAARLDGKPRQHWLTEFGWDTLAGHVVTPYEQAVYLPRAWMMAMAAGVEKAFWFYHFDAENPGVFFDGCGLLSFRREPKLSLCSLAGMTSILPTPKYVGMINAGDNTAGYVFEQDGKLVASLFSIEGDNGPEVSFQAEKVYDYLGNAIDGQKVKLTMAPVYAVGISRDSIWMQQAAYSLESPYLVVAAAGDTAQALLRVENGRKEAIKTRAALSLPEKWSATRPTAALETAAGMTQVLPLSFDVAASESLGMKVVDIHISEGKEIKKIPLKVLVQPPLAMQVAALEGRPGKTEIAIKVANKSQKAQSGTVQLKVPSSWSSAAPSVEVRDLKPGEVRGLKMPVDWKASWQPSESAGATFTAASGASVTQPIIPSTFAIHQAKNVKIDADLSDWPAETRLPMWMLGSTLGEPQTRVHLAWAKEGLYGACEVADASLKVASPKTFWLGEVIELFVDTADSKTPRSFVPGDHQFWFVPLVDEKRAFVGQWKVKDEIAETRYDLPNVKTAVKRQGDGYVMEFMIPAEYLQKYQPATGSKLGINLNLTVHGEKFQREVYWPRSKATEINVKPASWGTVELVD